MKSLARFLQTSLLATTLAAGFLPAAIALGAGGTPQIAEGRPWTAPELGLTLTPPSGWQIQPNSYGKTLVLQPVRKQAKIKDYSKPIYNRNITLAVLFEGRPIDEAEAMILRKKLEADFGKAPGVRDFQVLEHRFIDYRQKADGILLYTSFLLNGFPMSQMHIFLSGSKNSVLLTYTDLADAFQSNDEATSQAWNAMLSTELTGTAPKRYQDLIYAGEGAGALLAVALLVLLLRRRTVHKMYEGEEEKLYRDDAVPDDELSHVTGLATSLAKAPAQERTRDVTDVWNLDMSQVSTTLPIARRKQPKSEVQTAY